MVSRGIRTCGIKVLAGDLVNKKKEDMVEENGEQISKEEFIEYAALSALSRLATFQGSTRTCWSRKGMSYGKLLAMMTKKVWTS